MNFFILKYYLLIFMNQLSIYLYKRDKESLVRERNNSKKIKANYLRESK